jgi:hypothetical protein
MKSFLRAISNGEHGFVIKNSLFLPFHCEIISIWIGKEMTLISTPDFIVDLSDTDIVGIREGFSYTNLVFKKWNDLVKELGYHKGHVILHAAEKESDVFINENLHYIRIGFQAGEKNVSLEVIDSPYDL